MRLIDQFFAPFTTYRTVCIYERSERGRKEEDWRKKKKLICARSKQVTRRRAHLDDDLRWKSTHCWDLLTLYRSWARRWWDAMERWMESSSQHDERCIHFATAGRNSLIYCCMEIRNYRLMNFFSCFFFSHVLVDCMSDQFHGFHCHSLYWFTTSTFT